MKEKNIRIDNLPITSISLSESMLLLTYAEKEDERAQYSLGREINFQNRKYIYTPLMGSKIGPDCLPRTKFFHKIQTEIS